MLVPMIAACGNKKTGEVSKSKPTGSAVGENVTFINDDFRILCRKDNILGKYQYEVAADEGATDTVSQAVYQRNRDVCDMFGLTEIVPIAIDGDWSAQDNFINKFRNSIDAQLHEFDLIMGYQAYMCGADLAQYFYNFNDVPYVGESLDKEYYYQSFINEMTINGQLKYMVGDYSLTYYDHAYVMYFNKQLAEEYALENIYDLVNAGNWTMDKCLEMARGKWRDMNNDDWPDDVDVYGYISDIPNTTDAWHANFDVQPTSYQNGEIVFDADVAKMNTILETMIAFKKTNDAYFIHTSSDMTPDQIPLDKIFMEGRALFYPATLEKASNFRSMDIGFGIIPVPKWDSSQSGYYTSAQDGYSVACVPSDVDNLEKSGAVFDVLTQLSYENVVPAYYDQALKYKMTRDEDSAAMLDIIRDGFVLNFGVFYNPTLDCVKIRNLMGGGRTNGNDGDNPNFASYYESHKKGYQRALADLLKAYE